MRNIFFTITIGILLYPCCSFSQIKLEEINWNGGITKEMTKIITTPTSIDGFNRKFTIGSYIGINTRITVKDKISASLGITSPSIGYKGNYRNGWEHTTKDFAYLGLSATLDYKILNRKDWYSYAGIGFIRTRLYGFGILKSAGFSNQSQAVSESETYSFYNRGYILTIQSTFSKKIYKQVYVNAGLQAGLGFNKLFATKFTYYYTYQDYLKKDGHSSIIETKGDFIACYLGIQYHINKLIKK